MHGYIHNDPLRNLYITGTRHTDGLEYMELGNVCCLISRWHTRTQKLLVDFADEFLIEKYEVLVCSVCDCYGSNFFPTLRC